MAATTTTPLYHFDVDSFPYAYLESVVPTEKDGKQGGYARVRFLNDEMLKEVSASELKPMPERTGNHFAANHLLLPAACCAELELVNVTQILVTNELMYTAFDLIPCRFSVMSPDLEKAMYQKMFQLWKNASPLPEPASHLNISPKLYSHHVYSCCVIL